MNSWSSYPSIFAVGHKAVKELLDHEVNVEEKVDGSQFSFGRHAVDPDDNTYSPDDDGLCLRVRSKGAIMNIDAPQKMFAGACQTVKNLQTLLHPYWTYRGEVLCKPKHNALAYDRKPSGDLILFDVTVGNQEYLDYEAKVAEAERLGLEVVPRLYSGHITDVVQFRNFLETTSVLGGQKIEGVVIKPTQYDLFGTDKKLLMAKFVSESFKEVHRKAWGESNPSNKDVIQQLVDRYTTAARWNKALIHLRERGLIEDSPRDIGLLIREVPADVFAECESEMKEALWDHVKKQVTRGLTRGLPEWYKQTLLTGQFEKELLGEPTE